MTHLTALAWMMGLLLAPHSLALLGNLAGAHQRMFFIWLIIAAAIYWINARSLNRLTRPSARKPMGAHGLVLRLVQMGGRWVTAIALSTVLLVTAGFSFNETFLFWFPNFAFAFLLLGMILAVQLWGPIVARRLQLTLLALVLAGLAALIVMGLWGSSTPVVNQASNRAGIQAYEIFAMLLLFVGFDLVSNQASHRLATPMRTMTIGLGIMVLVWGMWGWVSLAHVPAAKLADAFIPHIITARNVGGNAGRMIMAMVIIAGSVAAVNALMTSQSQSMSQLATRWPTYHFKQLKWVARPVFWSILSAVVVGVMMASGMAGADEIDLYVRAGLIIWMFYYCGLHLAVLAHSHGNTKQVPRPEWVLPAIGALTMGIGAGALLLMDPHGAFLTKIISAVAIVLVSGALIGQFFKTRFKG